jgi:flagella basal body P-ring formation protein FlgA
MAICIATTASAVQVKLREEVVPKSSVVRLGDVAEISSADRAEMRRLSAVPLMPAPASGTERFLRQREVADMLAANGVDMRAVQFGGAEKVSVKGGSGVAQAAFNEPAKVVTSPAGDRRAEVLAGGGGRIELPQLDEAQVAALNGILGRIVSDYLTSKTGSAPAGRVDCKVSNEQLAQLAMSTTAPVCTGGAAPWSGRQRLTLSFTTGKGPQQMSIVVNVSEPAIVAVRPVARGSMITAADVALQIVEPSVKASGQRVCVDSLDKIIGKEARQQLQAGEIVYADQVQMPVIVKRGELITVASQGGGIRVRTSARALQDGSQGDLIQVESLQGKQKFDARVVGLREAAVFSPARVSTPRATESAQTARRLPAGETNARSGAKAQNN